MGIMPVVPLRSVLILSTSVPARANVPAAFVIGHTIANPFVVAAWYWLALMCGNALVTNAVTWERVQGMMDEIRNADGLANSLSSLANIGGDIIVVLLSGGALVALPAGVATYFVALRYFSKRREKSDASTVDKAA